MSERPGIEVTELYTSITRLPAAAGTWTDREFEHRYYLVGMALTF